jgi:outer membrane receptor protein involved in Fe transport
VIFRSSGPRAAFALSVALVAVIGAGPAQAQDADGDGDEPTKPVTELVVTARRLDAARANVDPALGASTYSVTNETVEARPGNEAISVAKVLLQFPGVQADGTGQLRVRQSQGDLQYRVNNVIIPEGASDLGDSLSARIAEKITVVTGALPPQYGFQTGGVVSVTTKSGAYLDGGQLEAYGGGRGEGEGAFELGASSGPGNLFLSGSFHRSPAGLASPDGSANPDHDRSDQADGFAYLDRALDDQTRVGLILGISDDRFQVPNMRGLQASSYQAPEATFQGPLVVSGVSDAASEDRDDRRREANRFAVASLMRTGDKLTVQLAAFARESVVSRRADGLADILFTGLGVSTDERARAVGAQAEAVYELAAAHTLRFGLQFADERQTSGSTFQVLPVDAAGRQTSQAPATLVESSVATLLKTSLFLQDEWRLSDDVTLNVGGRLDATRGAGREDAFSPRASLVWLLPSGATFHAGYARYFLPAPLDTPGERPTDLAGTTAATPTLAGDMPKSEHDDYVDVGVQQTFDHLTLGADAYARRAHNLIAEGEFGPANLPQTFNYDRARITGLELTATYAAGPLAAWTNLALARGVGRGVSSNQFYFTAAQLAALAAADVPLREDQRLTGSGGASYRWGRLTTSGSLLFGSGLPRTPVGAAVNSAHLGAYAQADLSLDYRLDGWNDRPLEARLDLINAFDTRYQLRDGTGLGDGAAAWGPRRGVFVGLEQTF